MIDVVLDLLQCPVDGLRLRRDDGSLVCDRGHRHDIARQGHVNLLGRAAPANADTVDMVAARHRFLSAGHYDRIVETLAERTAHSSRIVEVGAGTAHYLRGCVSAASSKTVGLATDISPIAARRAAKAHERIGAVVADTWAGLPVRSGTADAVLCVFAPRNAAEFSRVLAPGGLLVVVIPNAGHLAQARETLGLLGVEDDKLAKLRRQFAGAFEPVVTSRLSWTMELDAENLSDLVGMGPNAFHEHRQVADGMSVDADVQISLFRKPLRQF